MILTNKELFFVFSILFFVFSCKKTIPSVSVELPNKIESEAAFLGTIGTEKITNENIKESLSTYIIEDSLSYNLAIEEIIFTHRAVQEAKSLGYDKQNNFTEQLNTFKKVIAKEFITDTTLTTGLIEKTYARLDSVVDASHILLKLNEDAFPEDTQAVYGKLVKIKEEINNRQSFDSLATVISTDENTRNNNGHIGKFSALQLVYPLEEAAYTLPINGISGPIRTSAGYHIVRVNKKEASKGKIVAAHILIATPLKANEYEWAVTKKRADSLYNLIKNGVPFEDLVVASDDKTTLSNGGKILPFGIGERKEKSFEDAAFDLSLGEISAPVKTIAGWHIIKCLGYLPKPSLNEIYNQLKDKVTSDSRGEYLNTLQMNKLKQKVDFKENLMIYKVLKDVANPTILERKWRPTLSTNSKDTELFSIKNEKYTLEDFVKFAVDRQTFDHLPNGYLAHEILFRFYKIYRDNLIKAAAINSLTEWNPSYKNLISIYENDYLVNALLNDLVYEKSVADTTGQNRYYEAHKNEYVQAETARIQIITGKDSLDLKEFKEIIASTPPYRLKRGIYPIYYDKNSYQLNDIDKRRLAGLSILLQKNPSYIVELGGHSDINEVLGISGLRIKEVQEFLLLQEIKENRILVQDYAANKLVDRFDWSKNQRLSFQFYSNDKKDIAKIINSNENRISYETINTSQDNFKFNSFIEWKIGKYDFKINDTFYHLIIDDIAKSRILKVDEVRGNVIKGYQDELLKGLKERLSVKYPKDLDASLLNQLYLQNFKK